MFEERAAKVRIAHMVFLIQQNVLVAVSHFFAFKLRGVPGTVFGGFLKIFLGLWGWLGDVG